MAELKMAREHHAASMDQAKEKVQRLVEDMQPTIGKYVDAIEWNTDETSAALRGRHVKGHIAVDVSHLRINLKLSLAASLIKTQIESRIDEALRDVLGSNDRG